MPRNPFNHPTLATSSDAEEQHQPGKNTAEKASLSPISEVIASSSDPRRAAVFAGVCRRVKLLKDSLRQCTSCLHPDMAALRCLAPEVEAAALSVNCFATVFGKLARNFVPLRAPNELFRVGDASVLCALLRVQLVAVDKALIELAYIVDSPFSEALAYIRDHYADDYLVD